MNYTKKSDYMFNYIDNKQICYKSSQQYVFKNLNTKSGYYPFKQKNNSKIKSFIESVENFAKF